MAKEFKIILHRAEEANVPYLSGSEVSGEVVVEIDEPIEYESIKILLKGEGEATINSGLHARPITESEKYVDFEKVLWDENQSPGTDHVLPAGEHSFPFQFTLPSVIPSSFEIKGHAWIRYYLKAEILKSSRTYTVETPLQVTEVVDLNMSKLDKPFHSEKQTAGNGLFCVSWPTTITIEVPRTGYCVGEKITFRVTVENGSGHKVEVLSHWDRHNLFTSHTHKPHKDMSRGVPLRWSMEPHTTDSWEGSFTIPVGTPVLVNTKIIKSYFQLSVVVGTPHSQSLSVAIPIIIGNVPYRQA